MTEGRTTTFHVRTRSARWGAPVGQGDLDAWIERGWVDDAVEVSPDGKAWHAVGRHPAFASAFERAEPVRKAAGALDGVVAAAGGARDSAPRGPDVNASEKAPGVARRLPASVAMLVLLWIVAGALIANAAYLKSMAREAWSRWPPAEPVRPASSDADTIGTAPQASSRAVSGPSATDGFTLEQRAEAARLGVPVTYRDAVTGIRFVLIPGGSFVMGSPVDQPGRFDDEGPQHRVTLPAFYLSVHEVTNAQYRVKDPSRRRELDEDTRPVTYVTWEEAASFASWLSARGSVGGYGLPTEAQWEHACRAGSTTRFAFGDDFSRLAEHSWCRWNCEPQMQPVGTKPSNRWGLHDMHGNAWEWCEDDWHATYMGAPSDGRAWTSSPRAAERVVRGSWEASSAHRECRLPEAFPMVGFRLARSIRGDAGSAGAVSSTEPSASPAQAVPSLPPTPAWARVAPAQLEEAARLGVPVAYEDAITGMRFVLVPGGRFMMGSPEAEQGRDSDEGPQHRVTVPAFYLSIHEVTNAQYRRYDPEHASGVYEYKGKSHRLDGETQPVVEVDHTQAESFAAWLTQRSGEGGYSLPSEAQWEYACRAGTTTRWSFGESEVDLRRHGNYADTNHPFQPSDKDADDGHGVGAPVGSYRPNRWGLHDMHGNVWEWCQDHFHNSYVGAPNDGSAWVDRPRAADRTIRGGSWHNLASGTRSAYRSSCDPTKSDIQLGFRLARAIVSLKR